MNQQIDRAKNQGKLAEKQCIVAETFQAQQKLFPKLLLIIAQQGRLKKSDGKAEDQHPKQKAQKIPNSKIDSFFVHFNPIVNAKVLFLQS
ncbi:MAG: hypothetical protein K6A28_02225 [Bacteroidales bacterium]|nr:hypothetical protein [Bacteroidales bacterium]